MWALPDDVLDALAERLEVLQPDIAVEAGSGRSTRILARYATHVVTLEHHPKFARQTVGDGLPDNVDLRTAALAPYRTPAGRFPWYDTVLSGRIDFALIDGPPGESVGRQAAGFALLPLLSADGECWLDDYTRDHERTCATLWTEHLPIVVQPHPDHDRLAVIRLR